ncbi:hypothetical protein MMC12_008492, partial [Toensbergia leucococca]|nr:hypothetical protein [Toensbergia leucococca]
RIASKREEAEERPIAFVAHSLGGIVVKQALVEAKLDDSYKSICEATYGIAFFGTPHQRGNFAKLGDIAASIVRGVLRNPSNTFMEALKKDSLFSDTLLGDFRHQLEDYYVLSFFETLPMGKLGLIVDQKSATLGLTGLRERQIPMDVDHAGVCEFKIAEGDDDEQVSFNLSWLVESAVKAAAERARIALLSVPSSQSLSGAAPGLGKEKTLFLVPFSQDKQFVGQEDIISDIEEKLETEQRVALTGIGGVSKSQIAIEYCYRYRSKHPNRSIFWVHASTFERFDQAYKDIARRLNLPGWNDPKTNTLQDVSDWLTDEDYSHWLMVLDNADDADMFFNPQKETSEGTSPNQRALPLCMYLPQTSKGSILVTSRNRHAAFRLTNRIEPVIDVLPMEEEDAKTLLRKRLPDDKSSEDDIIALVKTLERLPLAVTQAAAYISVQKTMMTIAKYLAYIQQNEEILLADMGDLRRDPSVPNSVLVTWQISFDQIKKSYPRAAELLSLARVFDQQGIPKFLFYKDNDCLDFKDALAPLDYFALITFEADDECFGMHRLVQLAMRKWLHIHGETIKWEEKAVTLLSESFPSGDHQNWKICIALLPHAEVVLGYQYSKQHYSLQQAQVLHNTAWYLWAQGKYIPALNRSQKALSTRRLVLNEEDLIVLASLGLTATIQQSQGKYEEAEAMNRRTLELTEKVLGTEHPDTLVSMSNLAWTLERQGKYEEAEVMNRWTLELREKVLRTEHPNTLTSVWCLAYLLQSQKRYQDASVLYQRASIGYQEILGLSHPTALACLQHHKSMIELMKQQRSVEERADEEDKKYFAEHPRPDPSLYVDASSDDEDAMDVEESGLPSPPVSPRDTNHNITTIANGNAAQAHHSPSYPPPTALSHSIPVQNSRVYKSRRRPVASTHERFILLLSLFMLVTNKLL